MKWTAAAYALEHLAFPLIVALLLVYLFRDAPGTANPYVDAINHWLGFDQLMHALDHGM